jgi:hypothetical protein
LLSTGLKNDAPVSGAMKDIIDIAVKILSVVPRRYKGLVQGCIDDLRWKAPELMTFSLLKTVESILSPRVIGEKWCSEVILATRSIPEISKGIDALLIKLDERSADDERLVNDTGEPICIGMKTSLLRVLETWTGDKVKHVNTGNGTGADQEMAFRLLTPGKIYTVDRVSVKDCSSSIWLKEIPGVPFNTVLFTAC